jgi:hypothetical protein
MAIFTIAATHLIGIPLYLDPGSGSFLLQILLAALLGGALAIKIYWKKIKALFTGKKENAENIAAIESLLPPADASDEK